MSLQTFSGGIHPPYFKEPTKDIPIRPAKLPSSVTIPLNQHTGEICKPLVGPGDKVKTGTLIASSDAFVSSPIHASISGRVAGIEDAPHPVLGRCPSVVIEGDGDDSLDPAIEKRLGIDELSHDEIREIIRNCGIVGLGGGAFPTHVKLTPLKGKNIDTFILNGAECEPYLTCDHRLMTEKGEEIFAGLRIAMKVLGIKHAYVAIENNKADAIASMEKAIRKHAASWKEEAGGRKYSIGALNSKSRVNITLITLRTKYPQGGERQLIKAILDREVPSGGLPFDVGVVVHNAGTVLAIYEAVAKNKPLYERVVTVAGACCKEPGNLLVRIGTLVSALVEDCGGLTGVLGKVIVGGPMMGLAQYTLDVPVVKGACGVLLLPKQGIEPFTENPCIKCARCVDVCPVEILPSEIGRRVQKGKWEDLEGYNIRDCIECGSCDYVCPAKIPLVQLIKLGKLKRHKHG